MQFHPLADLFPLMSGAEFEALVADIREHGLREPIVTHENMILDGRNRFRACGLANVAPRFEEWDQDGTAQSFVVSKNLHRRHLNESQRGQIAARLANIAHGQVGRGHEKSENEISISDAAALLNVNRSTAYYAKIVEREGTPEQKKAIESGNAAVSTVARQIRGRPQKSRTKKNKEPMSQVGKNPERIQRLRVNAEIWGRIRDALTHLTSLPLPADVVAIMRTQDQTGFVDARLTKALQYLKDLEHEWNQRDADAA